MSREVVEVYFILDLNNLSKMMEREFVDHFNSFLAKQKKKETRTYMTTILLYGGYTVMYDKRDVRDIDELNDVNLKAGYVISARDSMCITLSKRMLFNYNQGLESNKLRTFFVVLTNNTDSESVLFTENESKAFINYFKVNYGWEFYAFGLNPEINHFAEKLGIVNAQVINTTSKNSMSRREEDVSIEVPTFLRRSRPYAMNS